MPTATPEKPQEMQMDETMQSPKDHEKFMLGLIRNQKLVLDGALEEAKLKFADTALMDDNWQEKNDRKIHCKSIEVQIAILSKIERDFMAMFSMS